MIRFGKNKTNIVATIIMVTMILLAVFVPILTSKNFTRQETQIGHLPPRVPILERFGIFDGTREFTQQTVDRSTIDPETGLGLPFGFDPDLIVMSTLRNNVIMCSDNTEVCVGGQNVLRLENNAESVTLTSNNFFMLNPATNPIISIDVNEIRGSGSPYAEVYLAAFPDPLLLGVITAPGVYDFDVFDLIDEQFFIMYQLQIVLKSETEGTNRAIALNSVRLFEDTSEEPTFEATGRALARFTISNPQHGRYIRENGELLQASFRFKAYEAAFGEVERRAFSARAYYALIEENQDICVQLPPGEDNPLGWNFSEGCPITRVVRRTSTVDTPEGPIYSYHLFLNYAIFSGYDPENLPFFIFGTTAAGHDFFALIWLGLRTSLLIGLIVATINISIGIVYGAIEGYYGGTVDLLMERFGEIIGRIPFLVWLGLFVIIFGPGVLTLIVLLTVTGWLGVASVTRTQFYRFKGREYVLASRTLGAKDSRLIFRHILPNGIGTIITASVLMIPGVIFAEATISYLGFGIGHGQTFNFLGFIELSGVSIGVLLADGRTELMDKPYLTMYPAIIISILMITFNMFGNALRDAFNPSLRGSE